MSNNSEQPPRVQLGFSIPLDNTDDEEHDANNNSSSFNIGHTSPNWCDWDGGKIGGVPSWLNPRDLPDDIICCRGPCGATDKTGATPLTFVAQLYCPADDVTNNPAAFHRSLYVFACPKCCSDSSTLFQRKEDKDDKVQSADLLSKCVRVLRCQLPKQNDFYPLSGDGVEETTLGWEKHSSSFWANATKDDKLNLCAVCGQRSKGKCPKQNKWFCGQHHQKEYMRASKQYKQMDQNKEMIIPHNYLPSVCYESELVVEEEPDHQMVSTANSTSDGSNDADTMNSNTLFPSKDITDADANLEQSDLNELTGNKSLAEAATGVTDPTTLAFYARMNIGGEENDVRDQCLRYSRWPSSTASGDDIDMQEQAKDEDEGEQQEGPLWLSSDNRPESSFPPPCQHCGAERAFEFQILPQMIHYLLNGGSESNNSNDENGTENNRHILTESERAVLMEAKAKIESGVDLPPGFQEQHDLAVASARDALLGISRRDKNKSEISEDEGAKDRLDWGTIAVYTCTASCGDSGAYLEEAAWMQPPLD